MGRLMALPSNTSRASICDRLTREGRSDLVAAIEAGAVSAFAIGVALGWKKRYPITGRGPTNRAKRRDAIVEQLLRGNGQVPQPAPVPDGELSLQDSIQACELAWGPDHTGSVFSSMEQVAEAWARLGPIVSATCHRPYAAEVLKKQQRPGRKKRPAAA